VKTYVLHEPFEGFALQLVAHGQLLIDVAKLELAQMGLANEKILSVLSTLSNYMSNRSQNQTVALLVLVHPHLGHSDMILLHI
jgi:hypothetical protein